MTLDEAIKHAEEKAEELRNEAEHYEIAGVNVYGCEECAKEYDQLAEWLKELKQLREQTTWIPTSKRLPEKSYCTPFWLTVKLDTGKITTLKGTWGCWSDNKDIKGNSFDAFDCWKDVMINGTEVRLSQPIPKEQVLAWMLLPTPYTPQGSEE